MSSSVPVTVIVHTSDGGRGPSPNWRNRPQAQALSAGSLILITGGMHLALGLGWNLYSLTPNSSHFRFSWFIGVIVGAFVASPLIPHLMKRYFMAISSLLALVSAIIFTASPYTYNQLIAARYLNGLAVGFALIPFLVHAGEIGAKTYRGVCSSLEQYSFSLGIAVQVILTSQWSYTIDFAVNRVHGIICIVLAVLALSSTYTIIESPIFHLRRHNDAAALESICQLRRPQVITDARKALLEVQKSYVYESQKVCVIGSARQGGLALLKLTLYRSLVALTFTVPLSLAVRYASIISTSDVNGWPQVLFGALRLVGSLIALFTVDRIGRKLLSLFSLLCMGGFSIGLAVICNNPINILDTQKMSVVCVLALLFQLFAGHFTPSSSVYLSEAFPLVAKPYLMAFCVAVEQAVQIIIICTYEIFSVNTQYVFHLTVGIIMCVMVLVFGITLPETRGTTLRQAEHAFRRLLGL